MKLSHMLTDIENKLSIPAQLLFIHPKIGLENYNRLQQLLFKLLLSSNSSIFKNDY